MERFSKLRRSKKDATVPTPTAPTSDNKSTGSASRTPSPQAQIQPLATQQPVREQRRKLSPFRGLANLRTSAKRARSSPPASLPQSPSAASAAAHHQNHRLSPQTAPRSPLSAMYPTSASLEPRSLSQSRLSVGTDDRSQQRRSGYFDSAAAAASSRPKMPHFLTISQQDIEQKFQDLIWLERNRVQLATQNPALSYQWARVPPTMTVKKLDRYVNVQPWQNNRVRLQVPPGKADYINASPVALSTRIGDEHASRYIAMQGPKRNSVEHVWRMVVEQLRSPAVIVMLTETHDGPLEKCHPYFPRSPQDAPLEVGLSDEFADGFRATVRCEAIEPTVAGSAIELRKLVIRVHRRRSPRKTTPEPPDDGKSSESSPSGASLEDEDEDEDVAMMSPTKTPAVGPLMQSMFPSTDHERDTTPKATIESPSGTEGSESDVDERVVYHFLYTKWPDFGVPALEDIDSFFELMRLSREKNADVDNPRIVHCSAGVGRSGTFIALEHLMRELDSGLLEDYDDGRRSRRNGDEAASRTAAAAGGMLTATTATPSNSSNGYNGINGGGDDDDLIFSVVNQLREQRRTMVQAEPQYVFIYQVMRKLWQDKYGVEEDREPAAKRHESDPFVGR